MNSEMRIKGFFKDVVTVSLGNFMYLLTNILIGFLLPMIMGVRDYGYYKLYTMYLSYTGLLHFGFVDGILLRYGGYDYSDIDKQRMRLYSKLFIVLEIVIGAVVIVFSVSALSNENRYIGIFIGINFVLNNITLYYQYISQAVGRFKEFSLRKVINASGLLLTLIALFLIYIYNGKNGISYIQLLVPLQVIGVGLMGWYIYTYRDITFGAAYRLSVELNNIKDIFKTGLVLTISYEVSRLVLVLNQQFVSVLYDVETYAQYAFAYNILSCVTTMITAVSTVLFPKLKRMKTEDSMKIFSSSITLISCIVCLALAGYFPVKALVMWILPQYAESLIYLEIVFPTLALTSCVTIVVYTYYKILDEYGIFLKICCTTLIVAFLLNLFTYAIWKTPEAISFSTLVAMLLWYIISVKYLAKKHNVKWVKNLLYTLALIISFYSIVFLTENNIFGFCIYVCAYITITILFYLRRKLPSTPHN